MAPLGWNFVTGTVEGLIEIFSWSGTCPRERPRILPLRRAGHNFSSRRPKYQGNILFSRYPRLTPKRTGLYHAPHASTSRSDEIGIHSRLKICRPQGHGGSIPPSGIKSILARKGVWVQVPPPVLSSFILSRESIGLRMAVRTQKLQSSDIGIGRIFNQEFR